MNAGDDLLQESTRLEDGFPFFPSHITNRYKNKKRRRKRALQTNQEE